MRFLPSATDPEGRPAERAAKAGSLAAGRRRRRREVMPLPLPEIPAASILLLAIGAEAGNGARREGKEIVDCEETEELPHQNA